ncbi:lysylphosphatidylglycerol synthase transmembrane domain-containing protein [Chitinophaga pollutisoli]|uniref:Lysylphosphatidylglycerol synthase transmembrane domain-containing protein n=1 Tax=Chitinophaga pollutisoli TaxID=3133966 RepID=A0ABZ2YNY4_9BACT
MPKSLKTFLQFAVFLGLGILIIWWTVRGFTPQQINEIKEAMRQGNYWLLIPAMILGFASHWVRALRWRLLFAPLGYAPKKVNTFFAVMIGYLLNLAVPRLGEVARCGVLSRYEKIPVDRLVGTMIAERAIDLLCLIILLTVTVLVQVDVVGAFVNAYIWVPLSGKFTGVTLATWGIIALGGMLFVVLIAWLLRRFKHTKAGISFHNLLRGIVEGILSVGKLRGKGWFLFYTMLMWFLYFSQVYIAFWCLEETIGLGVKAALSILAFGSIGMIATQGGIGAYQYIVQQILILYGISATIGFAFGWIIWLAQTALMLVLGLGSMAAIPVYNKKHRTDSPDAVNK